MKYVSGQINSNNKVPYDVGQNLFNSMHDDVT